MIFRASQTPFDADLAKFVASRVEALRKSAAKDEALLAFLRTCLPAKDKLQALTLHPHPTVDATAVAVKSISDSIGKANETNALLAAFVEKYLKIPDPIPTAPTGPALRRASGGDLTGDAMFIFDAIYRDNRLVVAEQDGRGTSRSQRGGAILPNASDNDFLVSRGELLVMLPTATSESYKPTHVVCNKHGDVGELLQGLRLTPLQEALGKSVFSPLLSDI